MHFSFSIAAVALLANALSSTAIPTAYSEGSVRARDTQSSKLEARHTQQECEVACSAVHAWGTPAWTACVQACVANNYPTPPPSPQTHKKAKGRDLGSESSVLARDSQYSELQARHTQQECEVACSAVHAWGTPAWTACVQACVANNYPTPPPSPQTHKKAKGRDLGSESSVSARDTQYSELEARHTQQECEVACSAVHAWGTPAWTACVQACVANNYPTPPPSPQNHKKAKGRDLGEDDV